MNAGSATAWRRSRSGCRSIGASIVAALFLVLALAATALADTPFGGDPTQAVTPGLSCSQGNAPSCMWFWLHIGVGSDFVPFPTAGGSGVITSVTLPAMPNPGPMQVVILTGALKATYNPSKPESICCQVKQIGPTFTVPPNQITTVPQNLAVSAQKEANVNNPGETSTGDIAAISILSPTASVPLRYTGPNAGDFGSVYLPAPTAPNSEFVQPGDPPGYQLLARFNLGATPVAPVAAPPAGANGGLKLGKKPLTVGANGKTVAVGNATDPPTAATTQTLTAPAAARAASASKAKKPALLGSGKTTVPAGKTVGIKLSLNSAARAKLKKKGKLKATLTIVATNPQGEAQTTTKSVTIKSRPQHKKKH